MASPVKNFLETVRKGQLGQAVRRALNSVNIREPWLVGELGQGSVECPLLSLWQAGPVQPMGPCAGSM